jgi:hypothetical protein
MRKGSENADGAGRTAIEIPGVMRTAQNRSSFGVQTRQLHQIRLLHATCVLTSKRDFNQ